MALVKVALILIVVIKCVTSITNNSGQISYAKTDDKCTTHLEKALASMSKRRMGSQALDLSGYALHQPLRTVPYDMYLTDMRIRAPGKWAKVEKCRFDPSAGTLQTRVMFRDLSVTGKVKLFNENLALLMNPTERCNMTLRMRKAGLGFIVQPTNGRSGSVNTAATFVEPQYVSVHSYGCKSDGDGEVRRSDGPEARIDSEGENREEMTVEMEEVFMRGVRSLLTRYLEHHLEPALKDTLMMNLGPTTSQPTTTVATTTTMKIKDNVVETTTELAFGW